MRRLCRLNPKPKPWVLLALLTIPRLVLVPHDLQWPCVHRHTMDVMPVPVNAHIRLRTTPNKTIPTRRSNRPTDSHKPHRRRRTCLRLSPRLEDHPELPLLRHLEDHQQHLATPHGPPFGRAPGGAPGGPPPPPPPHGEPGGSAPAAQTPLANLAPFDVRDAIQERRNP